MIIGIVSGYFNPIHLGHIEYINESKKNCDYLIAIINNDEQVRIKGSIPFMNEHHRGQIVNNLKNVGYTIISKDSDFTVCKTIQFIKSIHSNDKLTFFNSGDRIDGNLDSTEQILCKSLGIEFVTLPLPKLYSSSKLIRDAAEILKK